MNNMMTFPKTWEEYKRMYSFCDKEEVYTNGSELMQILRIEQWLEHIENKRKYKQRATGASDCINRQDAIDAFEEFRGWLPRDKAYGYVCKLKKLPSVPLYSPDELQTMQDLEWAQMEKMYEIGKEETLQRTQMSLTKIIRCKDCKHWNTGNCNCPDIRVDCSDYYVGDLVTEEDFYCGFSKRREDEAD